MTERNAAVGLRILGPFATARGPGDGDALQNLDTTNLPDGAMAFVADADDYYRFRRASALTPAFDDPAIITPASGPGQWIVVAGQGLISFAYQIAFNSAVGPVTIANPQAWTAMPSSPWTAEDSALGGGLLIATAFWSTTTPSAGILTYSGPPAMFEMHAGAVCANGEGANAQQYGILISKNGLGLGTSDGFGRESQNAASTDNAQTAIEVRTVSQLFMSAGDTVQIALINRGADGDDVVVQRATLAVKLI